MGSILTHNKWRTREMFTRGDRVLLRYENKTRFGTVDKIGLTYGFNYSFRIRLVSFIPKRVYIYNRSKCIFDPKKVILLAPWCVKDFESHQINGYFGCPNC